MATIELRGIGKRFGDTPVLDGVSLDVADGEFLTLLGPSGCGKTTLLRIVAGLEGHDEGEIGIGGRSVGELAPKARDVAMVFQTYALYPYMTVAQNIALPLEMRRLSAAQRLPLIGRAWPGTALARRGIAADVRRVAEGLRLDQLLHRRPAQLSGGQRQRVALGRAMVRDPAAFLMDEPLSNLDAKLRVQARAEIAALHRRLGATFVYVTHDQSEAMTMSDRVAVMAGGRLLQVAPPQAIYDDPATLEVARFVGTPDLNVLPGRVGAAAIEVAGQHWPIVVVDRPVGAAVSVGVRPEGWVLNESGAPASTTTQLGRVRHIERLGFETLVHVEVERLSEPLIVRTDPSAGVGLALGVAVSLSPRLAGILVFDETGTRLPTRSVVKSAPRLVGASGG